VRRSDHIVQVPTGAGATVLYNNLWPRPVKGSQEFVAATSLIEGIKKEQLPASAGQLVSVLYESHLLFDQDQDEVACLAAQQQAWLDRARHGRLLRTLVLDVVPGCNLACTYCNVMKAQDEGYLPRGGAMSLDMAQSAIDQFLGILADAKADRARIVLFGGEPLLRADRVVQILEYAKERAAQLTFPVHRSVNTNGSFITAKLAQTLHELGCAVALSLDGPVEVHDLHRVDKKSRGSFASAWRALEHSIAAQCEVVVLTTLDPAIFPVLERFLQDLHSAGVKRVVLKLPTYMAADAEIYRSGHVRTWAGQMVAAVRTASDLGLTVFGIPEAKFAACEGIGQMLCVEPTGEVFSCPGGIRAPLGKADALADIPATEAYLNVASRTVATLDECQRCPAAGYCAGGCAADAERAIGTIHGHNPLICEFIRALVFEQLRVG
jgi:uncharacterized protein